MKKVENLTLKGYYESLPEASCPKTEFVNRVAERCGVSTASVRNWIYYGMKPYNKEHIKILAEETGVPEDKLWQ